MKTLLADRIMSLLIEIGSSVDYENEDTIDALNKIDNIHQSKGGARTWDEWNKLTDRLSVEELSNLTKGYVYCETLYRWSGGSVSPAITMFRTLEERDSTTADIVADWILPPTKNDYVPYGSTNLGAQSAKEYRQLSSTRRLRIGEYLAEEAESERRAETDRLRRKTQRLASVRDRDSDVRQKLKDDLSRLEIRDQLKRLIDDQKYSVEFYPTCLAGAATHDVIASFGAELKLAVLERLKGKHRGPWGGLKKRLLVSFESNAWRQSTPWDRQQWTLRLLFRTSANHMG